ncbi:oligopeptide transporter, OPT family [Caldithrix abyssi DSM 13497]|uniref:Oligopeptide transporter, OPT family n=1 Tax=Caldithrix abyssi DSM 13497 TaxID=880073 RepID=H1XNQ2_CALAY|nr:oligopeptide transporter, OPT family [Caldithrix abyssi]APF19392.1 putative oligopeptide transporter, OPT family [Caldithrix abyssi DSM 13497]EHO43290.1 oligopeptide transporter, OPT family [Caldithrix abyssi DSM 13497]
MEKQKFKPYVPADSVLSELTFKAVFLGVLMAIVLGAANAYLGMKAGLTVAATFPAAVVAMAALRVWKGNILEENIARTTASVGEALVAGAIFTIPAFVISGVWDRLHYFESTLIMLIGGMLGVLFVTILRRSMVEEADLPFPESVAAAEIVKAGQGGQTGASAVFASMGIAAIWELFKNSNGIQLIKDYTHQFYQFSQSKIDMFGEKVTYGGGFLFETPAASPALTGVGFIVGLRVAAVLFAGAVMGWVVLVPLSIFANPALANYVANGHSWLEVAQQVWLKQIRPFAVGTMIVAAFYTLYNLKDSLITGITKAIRDLQAKKEHKGEVSRLEIDLDFKKVVWAIVGLSIPMFFLYEYFSASIVSALLLTVIMIILGFLFAAVAGYLVGLVGSSNNPISGLTLSSLLIAAVLLVLLGVKGQHGVLAVLGVAGVICTSAGIAGDMTQDLKVGHILGGTPWKMEIAEIIGVIIAALVLIFPMIAMDQVYHIGSAELPAPQAGLMALMAKGIVGGEMSWPLVLAGMFFAIGLIMIKSPSPMLIAVGMYLPFHSTAAIFVGGVIRWMLDTVLKKRNASDADRVKAENKGVLISSGLIAGEALMAVILAFVVLGERLSGVERLVNGETVSSLKYFAVQALGVQNPSVILGLLVFAGLIYLLVNVPLKAIKK